MVLQKLNAAGDQFKDAIQNSDYELEKKKHNFQISTCMFYFIVKIVCFLQVLIRCHLESLITSCPSSNISV